MWETPSGLINSIGLPNKGLDGFLEHDFPFLAELPVPLIVSVMGFDHEQLARLVEAVGRARRDAAIELNFSCPNVETGLIMGADPGETAAAMEVLRPLTDKPLIAKLTPTAHDQAAVARAAEEAGADALSLINTMPGMALDPGSGQPWLGGGARRRLGPGGPRDRAGPGPRGRRCVAIPVIGMGGIASGARRRRLPRERARRASRSAPKASATRPPAFESGRISSRLLETSAPEPASGDTLRGTPGSLPKHTDWQSALDLSRGLDEFRRIRPIGSY